MLLLRSFFRLKELFEVKNGLTASFLFFFFFFGKCQKFGSVGRRYIQITTSYVHLISQNIFFANLVNIIVEFIEQSSHLFSSSNFRPVVMEKGPQLGDKIMFNFHLKPPFFITGLWYFAFGQLLQLQIHLQTKNRSV